MTSNVNAMLDEKETSAVALKDESVQEWLDDILAEMAREFPDPIRGQKYASRIRILFEQATREVIERRGRFSRYARPVDATQDLLIEKGHPIDVEEVIKLLRAGGFDGGTDANIRRSLGVYRPRARNTRKALKRPLGKERWVGLREWPDSMWEELL